LFDRCLSSVPSKRPSAREMVETIGRAQGAYARTNERLPASLR
jgi:hypothetical protein